MISECKLKLLFPLSHQNMAHLCIKEAGRSVESTRISRGLLLSRRPVASRTVRFVNNCDAAKSSMGVTSTSMTQTIANPTTTTTIDDALPASTSAVFSTQHYTFSQSDSQTISSEFSLARSSSVATSIHPNETIFDSLLPDSPTLSHVGHFLLLLACPLTLRNLETDENEFSHEWHLRCDNVSSLLTWRSRRLSALIRRLESLRVTLVLTQCDVAPFELATLASAGISCVDHLPAEEMTWLAETLGCQVVHEVAEVMEGEYER